MDGMDGMDGMGPFVQELLADDDHAHLHDVPLETTACNIPLSEAKGSTFQWKTWGTRWTRPIDGPILPHTLPIKVGIFWLAMLYKLPESMRVYCICFFFGSWMRHGQAKIRRTLSMFGIKHWFTEFVKPVKPVANLAEFLLPPLWQRSALWFDRKCTLW